jgi:hypothetical protein
MTASVEAYFSTGQTEQLAESHHWRGNAWVYEDGTLRVPVGPSTDFLMHPDGGTTVRHNREVAW